MLKQDVVSGLFTIIHWFWYSGRLHFTDLGKSAPEYVHHGAFYYAQTDCSHIRRVHAPMITPNGICLSPDGVTVHLTDRTSKMLGSRHRAQDACTIRAGRTPDYD